MESKMIGLFFGSFDPVHIGHVNVVTAALNSGKVDEVIIVPAYKSVWKNTETPFKVRIAMITTAFENISNVRVCDVELDLGLGRSVPTYKTLELLGSILTKFLIITTPETYNEIPQWQHSEEILLNNKFLIVNSSYLNDVKLLRGDECIYAPDITICSTDLREKIKNNQIVQPFIQEDVIKIINALELYK